MECFPVIAATAARTTHRARVWRRAVALGMLGTVGALVCLAGCASTPPHYPSATAVARIGKPLFDLEMRWSTPAGLHEKHGVHVATWRFNQYNYAGCTVTVRTDRTDVIREVTWTKGCGPVAGDKAHSKPKKH